MPTNASQAVKQSYIQALINDQISSMTSMEQRLDVIREDYFDKLKADIHPLFANDDTWKQVCAVLAKTGNPTRNIVEQLADLYSYTPQREFKGSGAEAVAEIYDSWRIDEIMKIVNARMILMNVCGIGVAYRGNSFELDILTPNMFRVVPDANNPTKIEKLLIKKRIDPLQPYNSANTYWAVWTDTEHYLYSEENSEYMVEGNDEGVNPYGRIPYIFVFREISTSDFFDDTTGTGLCSLTPRIAMLDSFFEMSRIMNCFKQPYISGDFEVSQIPIKTAVSPCSIFLAPGDNVNVGSLDFTIDIPALSKTINGIVKQTSDEFGVDVQFDMSGEKPVGTAVLMNDKFMKWLSRMETIFIRAEKELFELFRVVYEANKGPLGVSEMGVKFKPRDIIQDPIRRFDYIDKQVKGNYMSKVDGFIQLNPEFRNDRKAALKKLEEIHEENQKFVDMRDTALIAAMQEKNNNDEVNDEELSERQKNGGNPGNFGK